MFTYLLSMFISFIIMNILNFDQFTFLLGVILVSFSYIVYLIEEFFEIYETEKYLTFRVKEDEGDKE